MTTEFDFKKEWEKTRKQLLDFSQQAAKVAKKGEEELVKFSQKSMVHIDVTAANLKKEKLYYQIGKEYIASLEAAAESAALKKLVEEYKKTVKEEQTLQSKLKAESRPARKKAARKTSRAKQADDSGAPAAD